MGHLCWTRPLHAYARTCVSVDGQRPEGPFDTVSGRSRTHTLPGAQGTSGRPRHDVGVDQGLGVGTGVEVWRVTQTLTGHVGLDPGGRREVGAGDATAGETAT